MVLLLEIFQSIEAFRRPHLNTYNGNSVNRIGESKHGTVSIKANKIYGGAQAQTTVITSQQYQILKLLSGGVAGTFAACLTNPLELIKSQLQSSSAQSGDLAFAKGNPLAIAREILKNEGVAGFFRGLPPTLVGIIPARSCYFYAYSVTKNAVAPYVGDSTVANAILSGFAAGWAGNTGMQ